MQKSTETAKPASPSRRTAGNHGFTYIALLAAVIIIGILISASSRYWSNIMLRDKEEELLFRGNQYRLAIKLYTMSVPGRAAYPKSLDDLLQVSNTATKTAVVKHFLRQRWKDPISGQDFVEIRDPLTNGIMGVRSPSDKETLKRASFPEEDKDFEGKTKYSEWEFVSKITVTAFATAPGEEVIHPTRGRVWPRPK